MASRSEHLIFLSAPCLRLSSSFSSISTVNFVAYHRYVGDGNCLVVGFTRVAHLLYCSVYVLNSQEWRYRSSLYKQIGDGVFHRKKSFS